MGRPRKPDHLKVLDGETRPSQLNDNAPVPPEEEVVMPQAILEDDIAAEMWNALAPSLIRRKVLTAWDLPAFVELCKAWSFARQARDIIDTGGVLLEQPMHNGSSRIVKNPAHQVYRDNMDLWLRLASRFGLTPADRSKLEVDSPEDLGAGDVVAELLG